MAIRLDLNSSESRLGSARLSAATLVDNLKADATTLTRDLPALAKVEARPAIKHAGLGGGLFGGAGYLAANAAGLFFFAGGFAIGELLRTKLDWSYLYSIALGMVVMGVVLLLIAAICALVGKSQINKVEPPLGAINEAKATVAAMKSSLQQGLTEVKTNKRDRAADVTAARRAAND